MIKTLADFPWLLFSGHAVLQIAPGHIEAERIAIDMLERLFGGNIAAARFQRRHQLDFMVIVLGERGIAMIRYRTDRDVLDRVGRLLEKERRLSRRVGAALDRVRGIIAADAVDPAHRKHTGFADDRDCRRGHREDRPYAGFRLGRVPLYHSARRRPRAEREHGPAIDGIHGHSPYPFCFSFSTAYLDPHAAPGKTMASVYPWAQKKARDCAGLDSCSNRKVSA